MEEIEEKEEKEEDSWWRDYQASTKLKRRSWKGPALDLLAQEEDDEHFDNLLADLDSIVTPRSLRRNGRDQADTDSELTSSGYQSDTQTHTEAVTPTPAGDSSERERAMEAELRRLEEEYRLEAEERDRLKDEEDVRIKAEEEVKLKAEEAIRIKEEEEMRLKAEEEARLKAEEEAKLKAEEEAGIKAEEEARIKAEEETRLKAEEEERLKAEEEARLKAKEEARLKSDEEARLKAEEEARLKSEEEARLKAEEARLKAEEDERTKAEEEVRRKVEEETRLKAEEETRLKAEEETRLKAEEVARLQAEEDARLKAEEEDRRKTEEEARLKAEEEAKLKAEDETRLKAEEEARLQEEEDRRKTEEEARLKAGEEGKFKSEAKEQENIVSKVEESVEITNDENLNDLRLTEEEKEMKKQKEIKLKDAEEAVTKLEKILDDEREEDEKGKISDTQERDVKIMKEEEIKTVAELKLNVREKKSLKEDASDEAEEKVATLKHVEEERLMDKEEPRLNTDEEGKTNTEVTRIKQKEETRINAEEKDRFKAEEDAEEENRIKTEEEARPKAEGEARNKAEEEAKIEVEEEEEAKIKAEEEARPKPEEEPRLKAEKEVRIKAEEEVNIKDEEEARLKAEEDAKLKTEEEARFKAEEAARIKAEEEAKEAEEEARLKAEEEGRLKAEEEERLKAEEEARIKAEEEARLKVEEDAKIKAEEETMLKAEEESRLKAEEEARLKAEEEAKLKAEEGARIKAEEDAKIKAEEEARLKAEEEERIKAEEGARLKAEEEARLKAEEEARLKAEEELRLKEEEEARLRAEEEARLKAEEEARLKAEEELRLKEEEEARLRAEEEARLKAEEEAKLKAEEDARLKAEEEARLKAEEEARLKADEEARRKAEEEARLKAEEEARIKAEEEAKIKAEEEERIKAEEDARLKAEEEARLKAEEETRLKAEEETRLKAEEEARLKAEEEARLKAEEEARLKVEEEARIKAEEEARLKAEEDERIKAEEEVRRKAEEEAILKAEEEARLKAEEEARLKAEEEARRKAEEEARLKAHEEARLKAAEELRLKAEEEARLRAEEEARLKAEEESKLKAKEEARIKGEEEARLKSEEEAKIKAEEEARLKAEEEARLKAEEDTRRKAEKEARHKAEEEARVIADEEAWRESEKVKLEERLKINEIELDKDITEDLGNDSLSVELDDYAVLSTKCNDEKLFREQEKSLLEKKLLANVQKEEEASKRKNKNFGVNGSVAGEPSNMEIVPNNSTKQMNDGTSKGVSSPIMIKRTKHSMLGYSESPDDSYFYETVEDPSDNHSQNSADHAASGTEEKEIFFDAEDMSDVIHRDQGETPGTDSRKNLGQKRNLRGIKNTSVEVAEVMMENINKNLKSICSAPEFLSSEVAREAVQYVVDLLVKSSDLEAISQRLEDRGLSYLARSLSSDDLNSVFFHGVDPRCLDLTVEEMLENINRNILDICNTPDYSANTIIQENVAHVMSSVVDGGDKFSLVEKLRQKNLHSVAFRVVGPKIIRIFSIVGSESIEYMDTMGDKKNNKKNEETIQSSNLAYNPPQISLSTTGDPVESSQLAAKNDNLVPKSGFQRRKSSKRKNFPAVGKDHVKAENMEGDSRNILNVENEDHASSGHPIRKYSKTKRIVYEDMPVDKDKNTGEKVDSSQTQGSYNINSNDESSAAEITEGINNIINSESQLNTGDPSNTQTSKNKTNNDETPESTNVEEPCLKKTEDTAMDDSTKGFLTKKQREIRERAAKAKAAAAQMNNAKEVNELISVENIQSEKSSVISNLIPGNIIGEGESTDGNGVNRDECIYETLNNQVLTEDKSLNDNDNVQPSVATIISKECDDVIKKQVEIESHNLELAEGQVDGNLFSKHTSVAPEFTEQEDLTQPRVESSPDTFIPALNITEQIVLIERVNDNVKRICNHPNFRESPSSQAAIKTIIDILGGSADVPHIIGQLVKMELGHFTESLDSNDIDYIVTKDITPNPEALLKNSESVIEIVNANIQQFSLDPHYSENETAQRKVRTVREILTETTDPEDIIDRLSLEGLQYFCDPNNLPRNIPSKLAVRDYSQARLIPRKTSIVGKILDEVRGASQTRMVNEMTNELATRAKDVETQAKNMGNASSDETSGDTLNGRNSRLDRNKESRKVKKFSRPRPDTSSDAGSLGTIIKGNIEDMEEKKDINTLDPSDGRVSGLLQKDNVETVEPKPITSESEGLSIESMEIKQCKLSLQRSFTEIIKESTKRKGEKSKVRRPDDNENSIVSKILKEKKSGKAESDNVTLHHDHISKEDNKNKKDNVESNASASIPRLSEIKATKPDRERTESVCSENLPDLSLVEEDRSECVDAAESAVEKGGVVMRRKKTAEGVVEKISKQSVFLTSFEDLSDEDADIESDENDEDDMEESDRDYDNFEDNKSHFNLQRTVGDLVKNLLEEKFTADDRVRAQADIRDAIVTQVNLAVEKVLRDHGGTQPGVREDSNFPMVKLEQEDLGQSFDISMKRLELIENKFRSICSEPREHINQDGNEELTDSLTMLDSCPSCRHNHLRSAVLAERMERIRSVLIREDLTDRAKVEAVGSIAGEKEDQQQQKSIYRGCEEHRS